MLARGVTYLQTNFVCVLLVFIWTLRGVMGHGRLVDPPSRSSMWRYNFNTPHNYNDNQLFCGGVSVQYQQNGGKCGVCGDPWQGPRDNEPGGKYATGIIVKKYGVGQVIKAKIELTASHKGYFEFRLCPNDSPFKNITHECLDNNILRVADTGSTRYMIESAGGNQLIEVPLKLPDGVKCRACVFQWKYNAGNSWGTDPNGKGCIGCGNQEQFYGCADVAIGYNEVQVGIPPVRHPWFFETDDRWHWGIVERNNNTMFAGAQKQCTGTYLVVIALLAFFKLLSL